AGGRSALHPYRGGARRHARPHQGGAHRHLAVDPPARRRARPGPLAGDLPLGAPPLLQPSPPPHPPRRIVWPPPAPPACPLALKVHAVVEGEVVSSRCRSTRRAPE